MNPKYNNIDLRRGYFSSLIEAFTNNKPVFSKLAFIIFLPFIVVSILLYYYAFEMPYIHFAFSVFTYFIAFMFSVSFVVLYKLSDNKQISFNKTLKLILKLPTQMFLQILVFAFLFVYLRYYFSIGSYVLIAVLPSMFFKFLFQQEESKKNIYTAYFDFLKSNKGKEMLIANVILAVIVVVALLIIINITKSFVFVLWSYEIVMFISSFFYLLGFTFLFLSSVMFFSELSFNLPNKFKNKALDVVKEKLGERKRKTAVSEKQHKHKKETDFNVDDDRLNEKGETNRFTDDEGFNRFEDTEF